MSTDGPRVLIADGEEGVRIGLFRALLDREVFSDCAASGGDAIVRLAERAYALVVLDFTMPNAGAAAVMESLRNMAPERRPIVIGTAWSLGGHDNETDLVQMILRRPLRLREVAAMVGACLALTSARDEMRRAAR